MTHLTPKNFDREHSAPFTSSHIGYFKKYMLMHNQRGARVGVFSSKLGLDVDNARTIIS